MQILAPLFSVDATKRCCMQSSRSFHFHTSSSAMAFDVMAVLYPEAALRLPPFSNLKGAIYGRRAVGLSAESKFVESA